MNVNLVYILPRSEITDDNCNEEDLHDCSSAELEYIYFSFTCTNLKQDHFYYELHVTVRMPEKYVLCYRAVYIHTVNF